MTLPPLSEPDQSHIRAAQGWIELGNHLEANEELEQVTPEHRAHPDVLTVRWQVFALAGRWDACVDVGWAITAQDLVTLTRLAASKPKPLQISTGHDSSGRRSLSHNSAPAF